MLSQATDTAIIQRLLRVTRHVTDAWVESEHERLGHDPNAGQFAPGQPHVAPETSSESKQPEKTAGQQAAAKSHATRKANAAVNRERIEALKAVAGSGSGRTKHVLAPAPKDRAEWPAHVKKLVIPPAWTDLKINPDPQGDLLVTGKDSKGRAQYVYSEKFKNTKSAEKFKRIQVLEKKFDQIEKQVQEARQSKDPVKREHAEVTRLIMQTGIRPGSETDTGAEKQAYGATTLKGEHVKAQGNEVVLSFVGKKGVSLNIPVTDPDLVKTLKDRAKQAGPNGKLFPQIDDASLRGYVHTLDGKHFKTKDLRTRLGTKGAMELVAKMKAPTNAKEYKTAVKEVATSVAEKLGNTAAIALASYISPVVFAGWRVSAKV